MKWHSDYGAYPVAHVQSDLSFDSSLEIIPVVYITNEALLLTPMDSISSLTDKVSDEIDFHWGNEFGQRNFTTKEIQFDCDWTPKSREKYFLFLQKMKERRDEPISCTVKMYQYAYRETVGIPPVDKAVLMCYNLQNLRDPKVTNSIFESDEAKKYLKTRNYPLPLDIALPEFSWVLLFRNQVFKGVDYSIDPDDLSALPLERLDSSHYVFTSNFQTFWNDVDYMKGDIIKIEKAGSASYLEIADELKKHFNQLHTRIILFDLSHLENSDHAKDSTYFKRLSRNFSF